MRGFETKYKKASTTSYESHISDQEDFLTSPVEILVFARITGYMFTSSGCPLWN